MIEVKRKAILFNFLLLLILRTTLLADIFISKEVWDFGKIEEGKEIVHIFNVRNTKDNKLIIKRIRTSCGCITAIISSKVIDPGRSAELKVRLNSSNREGNLREYVYIESNDPESPIKRFTITGRVDRSVYVRIYFFYSKDCKECLDIKNNYIPRLRLYPLLRVRYLDIGDPENYRLMLDLEERHGYKLKNPPPTIFIGDQVLDGGKEIRERLEEIIRIWYRRGGCLWPDERPLKKTNIIIERFRNLGVLAVISGGLLDGINPCAFTTLICFISYLLFIGHKGRKILLVGIAFILTVFTTYLLVGIGLFESIKRITIFPLLDRIVSLLVACVVFLFGIFTFYDYYLFKRKGLVKGCSVRLGKIVGIIKRGSRMKHYLLGAVLIGLLISILEFSCTGQIYLPIIIVLRYLPELQIHSLFYLVLYNLFFILPLIVVFILVYYGANSEIVTKISSKHQGKVKILTAILFFGIALVLVAFKI